ncbi:M3 family oligoendopeptidase [Alicyclobacillus ferrooxydans]|uniref:Peptidase M3A/M3B catalytic domain-containing protein n=1 Tax=Alicyclobacillus ferrooxydans TaxID=471514 RepID=A0A0N8PPG7_9BACL|nr:M3 family oligoendopeptidase [Alicyclobacillus ferrooxydans]KPV44277.1 hypothetical protein AN477_08265 [Alicyclobacillus ferrooxydans]
MKASEWTYQRPDMEDLSKRFHEELTRFESATSEIEQWNVLQAINDLSDEFETMYMVAFIRHTQDTSDEQMLLEKQFFDAALPTFEGWNSEIKTALLNSKFRAELEQRMGRQVFSLAEAAVKTYAPEVEDDLRKENELSSKHMVWLAQAKIPFDGAEKSLNEMNPYYQSPDRTVRKSAWDAVYAWMSERASDFDNLYHDLVSVRTSIARKLGYENFVGLGYARMSRVDYTQADVAKFRTAVKEHVVPLLADMAEQQRQRIGVDTLTYYDKSYRFGTGNPTPKGDMDWIEGKASDMYNALSPETGAFFKFMRDNELLDLKRRPNKAMMGYCTYLAGYKSPFVFSLDNGTAFDVIVVTHEAGHAFQKYMNERFDVPEYRNPTKESAEIFSKSMELFTWPWMEQFFLEDTVKFKYDHLVSSLGEIAYVSMYDEFQEVSYAHPEWTIEERRKAFREIQRTYEPYLDANGQPYLEEGYGFHSFNHIYRVPFYTIDYALAQICAFQFWQEAQADEASAWEKYIALAKLSGSLPFQQLITRAGLRSPFEDGCVADVAATVGAYLAGVDDKAL